MTVSFDVSFMHQPSERQMAPLRERFWQFTQSCYPGLAPESEDQRFLLQASDSDGALIGGILGAVYWDGLEIDILWVAEAHRGRGIGSRLMSEAEAYARTQGAVISFLRTVAAEAFYHRLGYATYGVLEDRPRGSLLFHMKKRLDT